ncbi:MULTISPECIES: VOC family protein [unclassified Diaminobutyricimonas]|uniref:VOC family protein n=1 Tax=unclassified Diaminobutyricimonas TaxID=2643261 RepID=UPI0012F51D19|nr:MULTISPECIES: VOC family protein [unclassified Diaminobutyricimonas]
MTDTAVGRLGHIVIDCPDATGLAAFYGRVLGLPVDSSDPAWPSVTGEGYGLLFQQVDGYRAPQWPGQDVPQQLHLDVNVADLHDAHAQVLALGAVPAQEDVDLSTAPWAVYLDPAGHPFCLVRSA